VYSGLTALTWYSGSYSEFCCKRRFVDASEEQLQYVTGGGRLQGRQPPKRREVWQDRSLRQRRLQR